MENLFHNVSITALHFYINYENQLYNESTYLSTFDPGMQALKDHSISMYYIKKSNFSSYIFMINCG